MTRALGSLLLPLALSIAASGCTITSNKMSCSLVNATTKMPEKCVEYTDFDKLSSVNAKASLTILCKAFNASIKSELCDTTSAVYGCQKDTGGWTQTEWTYTGSVSACGSNEVQLGPDRMPLAPSDLSASSDLSSKD